LLAREVTDYGDLVAAVRARLAEVGISGATLDELAGVPARYSQKIIGPRPSKTFGPASLGSIPGALGLRLVIEPDPEQERRMAHRWTPRQTSPAHPVHHAGRGRNGTGEAADSLPVSAAI
jgi:hypothetical protein